MLIADLLAGHHKHCDEMFVAAEDAVAKKDWAAASRALAYLISALEAHFTAEEETLFPAFERASGMRSGPTAVMREEHRQMRELLQMLQQALYRQDGEAFAGVAETLLILMQQHNMKEENILYPMCDRLPEAAAVSTAMRQHPGLCAA
jgi:iron-sulfur cluster repair protein YtfE (RIC family)